jgi:hypothetical protein
MGLDQVFLRTITTAASPRTSSPMKSGHRNGALPKEIPEIGESVVSGGGATGAIDPGVGEELAPAAPELLPLEPPLDEELPLEPEPEPE